MQYQEVFSDLAGVVLEDSWVLEVAPSNGGLAFRLDTVLAPEHPLHESPRPGEQHCYRPGWLALRSGDLELRLSGSPPAVDVTGETDLGHIDRFAFDPATNSWEIEGDWGYARAGHPEVALRFD